MNFFFLWSGFQPAQIVDVPEPQALLRAPIILVQVHSWLQLIAVHGQTVTQQA